MLSCIISFNSNNYRKFAIIILDFLKYTSFMSNTCTFYKTDCTTYLFNQKTCMNLFIIKFSNFVPILYSSNHNVKNKYINCESPCCSCRKPMSISSLRSQNDIKLVFIVNVLEKFSLYCQYILVRPQKHL